jgi:hypothetical protein
MGKAASEVDCLAFCGSNQPLEPPAFVELGTDIEADGRRPYEVRAGAHLLMESARDRHPANNLSLY